MVFVCRPPSEQTKNHVKKHVAIGSILTLIKFLYQKNPRETIPLKPILLDPRFLSLTFVPRNEG